ncbi:uncharacterized protein EI97DRAFT_200739 [Westerdykella ornata]|uniref:Uncharacterized protein n=1 Tax=Westerdykella ornata TaxID=318751 RepID=A0A6A6J9B3_WESOR|nr:uncharacterized protein EI97DRAFT_200739 [Westerdykella ornata]KAF2272773.1 hypothetical protein EI97DRAFT_200739 [Westerdykella ornata]
MGSLFRTNFDIAAASVTAAWTSSGYMSFTMYTVVFLLDLSTMRQKPYYLINVQYAGQTAFQLKQGDPCTISLPDSPAITIRETRTFIQARYFYGIPGIANVNLQVQLLGWFEVGYGVQLVTKDLINPLPGQIVGYIRPGAGLGGQISANVQILVASGGLQGNLDFAAVSIPAGGGMITNSLSPFSVGFGDVIQLQGRFLSGRVSLHVSIWNCCCWYCWFSCCFRCGGGCNWGRDYTIFQWAGINPSPFQIDSRRNLCASLISSTDLPPVDYSREQARLSQPEIRPFSATPPEGMPPVGDGDPTDSEFWCLCEGFFNPAAGFQWLTASAPNNYGYLFTVSHAQLDGLHVRTLTFAEHEFSPSGIRHGYGYGLRLQQIPRELPEHSLLARLVSFSPEKAGVDLR